jgi:hypothetical protein
MTGQIISQKFSKIESTGATFSDQNPSVKWPVPFRNMDPSSSRSNPPHWDGLSNNDKELYLAISAALSAPTNRDRRNKRLDDFANIIDAIELFINAESNDRWKRALVAGFCRFKDGVAINVGQFKRLILKCKSSINGSLKKMGYDIVLSNAGTCPQFLEEIPILKDSLELRQWTVRLRSTECGSQITAGVVGDDGGGQGQEWGEAELDFAI